MHSPHQVLGHLCPNKFKIKKLKNLIAKKQFFAPTAWALYGKKMHWYHTIKKKNQQMTKNHEKISSMQRVNNDYCIH